MEYDNMRHGDWMLTFTGKKFFLADPREEDICLLDIIHALSMECRYAGHCNFHYSVAQHTVLLYEAVPKELKKAALVHDMEEAYTKDFPRPCKDCFPELKGIAAAVSAKVFSKYSFEPVPAELKEYDYRISIDERAALFDHWNDLDHRAEPLGVKVKKWTPEYARARLLDIIFHEFPQFTEELMTDIKLKNLNWMELRG